MGRAAYTTQERDVLALFDAYTEHKQTESKRYQRYELDGSGNPKRFGHEWWSRRYWHRRLWAIAGGKLDGYLALKNLTPAEIKLAEDAARHTALLRDHEYYIRDLYRDDNTHTVGRVPRALNANYKPTTWEDLGIDPTTDPYWAEKYTEVVSKKMQGIDMGQAMRDEAKRRGINYSKVWG